MTDLLISGHGKARSGRIDPGATGIITKGEHRYMKEDLFPAMKKYVGDADVVFFSEYDVYEHGNIVELANKYGKDTRVTEFHYDAGSSDASGGHVIIKSKYNPDVLDLKLRDAINDMVGVRYSHNGVKGISGRDNLANVNRTAQAGVNYRLIELGFGTNKKDADVMMNQTDAYAKRLVEAILGKGVTAKPTPVKPKPQTKSIETLVAETKAGVHKNGEARKKSLGSNYDAVMNVINGGSVAKNKRVYLPKSAKTWRVYKTSGPYVVNREVGLLAPAQYGGLNYEIIKTLATDVYEIKTGVFGNVAIYAAKSTGATIK